MVHLNRMKSWPWAYDDVINLPLETFGTEPWSEARPLARDPSGARFHCSRASPE